MCAGFSTSLSTAAGDEIRQPHAHSPTLLADFCRRALRGMRHRMRFHSQETFMKSIILWLCGVPIGVIILLKVFGVF